jgi:hypothetical protein
MKLAGRTSSVWLALVLGGLAPSCSRPTANPETKAASGSTSARVGEPDAALADAATEATAPVRSIPIEQACSATATDVDIFVLPEAPSTDLPLRVVALSDRPLVGTLSLEGAAVEKQEVTERRGGSPYFWLLEAATPKEGAVSVSFIERGPAVGSAQCAELRTTQKTIAVRKAPGGRYGRSPSKRSLWHSYHSWSRGYENMYSAWIEHLFDAPENDNVSYAALHEVLKDPKKNLLFDYLGANEDSRDEPVMKPDCADLPYALRAYFAFKFRLPFAMAICSRGGKGYPPGCKEGVSTLDEPAKLERTEMQTFGTFVRGTLADTVHSGSGRTPANDEAADYYPVALKTEALRPGTIYADPYGHVLMIAQRRPQTEARGGILFAVDGQPDGTVARKRFWRGNFLFASASQELGFAGFKRFRPLHIEGGANGPVIKRSSNAQIGKLVDYADYSPEQGALGLEAFYDKMDDVLSPSPRSPNLVLAELIEALHEQVRARVRSVENGRLYLDKTRDTTAMPEDAEIFETKGAWEDFSTPARDLRLLIAIDVVAGFPARVRRLPDRFGVPASEADKLEGVLKQALTEKKVTYTRSDGSAQELDLASVVARKDQLEMAYNPNDCAEFRWGAAEGSPEQSTCKRRAPAEQTNRMQVVRKWFQERKRPPRK